jgi:iron complex transport system substrate-binding protein
MKKKLLAMLMGSALLITSFTACSENDSKKAESSSESGQSVSDTALSVDYSKAFKIEALEDGIKKVTDGDSRELILVPKSLGSIPDKYKDSTVITTPVENAVFLSSTQACMLRAAGSKDIWDSVGAVSGDASSFTGLDEVVSGLDSGKIINIGGVTGEPDYEQIQALNPDVVFLYTGEYGQNDAAAKLSELGINYAVDNEYLESDCLSRMEWMKFVLTFFNADEAAADYMNNAQKTFNDIKSKLDGVEGKKVALFNVYDGSAYGTSDSTWVGNLLKETGCINVFADITDYTISMETLFDKVQDADVIIYTITPSMCDGLKGIEAAFPQITECKAYTNDCVYQYTDNFWTGIDQTDVMAEDLASIVNPDIFGDRTLSYYVKTKK